MKKLYLFTIFSLMVVCLNAQNIKVLKFERLEKDMLEVLDRFDVFMEVGSFKLILARVSRMW